MCNRFTFKGALKAPQFICQGAKLALFRNHSRCLYGTGSEAAPGAVELPDDVDLDYFDRHDLGRLRRRLRNAVQRFRRERELYLELVLSYIDVRACTATRRCADKHPPSIQQSPLCI